MAREMKDSRIEWIGKIPSNWSIKRAKNCFSNHKDVVGNAADDYQRLALTLNGVIKRDKEDVNGLQPEKFTGYQILKENELVFKLIDLENISTSRVGLSPFTGIVSPAYIVLSPNDNINTKYAEYFYLSLWQREIFNHMGDDGVRSSLNSNDLLNIPITYPNIKEQQKIANFLDEKVTEIDKVIAKTKKSIEEYYALNDSIIYNTMTKGMNLKSKMKDSHIDWIGMIPEDWKLAKVGAICSMNSGKNLTSEIINPNEGLYEVFGGNGFRGFFSEYNISGTNILIGRQGALAGNVHYVDGEKWATDHALIVNNKGFMIDKYLFYLFKAMNLNQYAFETAAQPGLAASKILNLKLCFTLEKSQQEEIVKYLDKKVFEIDELIKNKEMLLQYLDQYKKSLIYEYVTGKKEVI